MELEFVGVEESENISAMAFPLYREVYTFVSHDVLEDFLAKNQTPEHIREQMGAGMRYAYILIRGDRAGYVCFCPRDGSMFLSKLYLLADHRGHGVGSDVIAYVEDIALKEGLSSISLDVQGDNLGAKHLYEKLGFKVTGTVGSCSLRMEKPLGLCEPI